MSKSIVIDLATRTTSINNDLRMQREVERLRRDLDVARQEIAMLVSERDELVEALREWARPEAQCPMDRYEIGLYDALPEALQRMDRSTSRANTSRSRRSA